MAKTWFRKGEKRKLTYSAGENEMDAGGKGIQKVLEL